MFQKIDSEKLSMRKFKSMGKHCVFECPCSCVNLFSLGRYWYQLRTIDMPGR